MSIIVLVIDCDEYGKPLHEVFFIICECFYRIWWCFSTIPVSWKALMGDNNFVWVI